MKDILVGLDGSVASTRALAVAAIEGARAGARVRAVSAWSAPLWTRGQPPNGYDILMSAEECEQHAAQLVDEAVSALRHGRPELQVEVVTETVSGSAREQLRALSATVDLVVVGSHGLGALQGLLLGSVAQYLLSNALCPLLIVPSSGSDPAPPRRVVVGADGSEPARAAMRWAHEAAARHGCPLVVLHGWLLTSIPGRPSRHYVPALREYETECQEWLDQEVAHVLSGHSGVELQTKLSYSSATTALRDETGPEDLLVVGRCGHGTFPGMRLGSVASQCAHHATSLLAVVPAPQEQQA